MKTTLRLRPAAAILSAALASAAAGGADVTGRILGEGAKPVPRAAVRLLPDARGASTKAVRVETGADGGFAASGLSGTAFTVRVEAKGYAPLTQSEIPAGAAVQLRMQPGRTLSGIVKDRISGAPIAGATVLAWDRGAEAFGEESYRSIKSGKDGTFTIADLPEGKVSVEARADGRAPVRAAATVPKAGLEVLMHLSGGVYGTVTDTAGAPVSGAEVVAVWSSDAGAKRRTAKSGADGFYRIPDGDTASLSRMAVKAVKFLTVERDGPVPAEGVVDFTLERGGSVVGSVKGYDGKAVTSFRVAVRPATDAKDGKTSELDVTDAEGDFVVPDLPPGAYTVKVTAERYASVEKSDVDVAAEQEADLGTLTLGSPTALRGRVVSARDGAAVSGAAVKLSLVDAPARAEVTGPGTWSAATTADGSFSSPSLPEGTFELAVEHPQFAPARQRVAFRPGEDAPELVVEMFRGGVLTGAVTDGKQEPVAGVRIVATLGVDGDSRVADTGSDGHYYMDGLAPGTWTVTRQQERPSGGASRDTKLAAIREGETTTLDFDESPRVRLSGTVLKGTTPIPSASIYFVMLDTNRPRDGKSTKTDPEGRFQIGLMSGGRYQVSVVFAGASGGNGHSVVTLTIPDQPEVQHDIVFTEQAISGHVVDPDGRGVKGALVTALRQGASTADAPRQATTMTVEEGVFRLDALDPGVYRVTARAKAFASDEAFPVVVGENEPEPDLTLVLRRGWIMRGRVVDPSGRGVQGALIVVAPNGAAESGYLPSQSDANGAFRITAPAEGPTNVTAISSRFAPAVATDIEPPPEGGGPEVVLQATPGGSMRIRVVRRSGEPVAGAQTAFQPVPLFPGSDVVMDRGRPQPTGPDGTTLLKLLHPSEYVVSIPGRRDSAPIRVFVSEGTETEAVLEVP